MGSKGSAERDVPVNMGRTQINVNRKIQIDNRIIYTEYIYILYII